MSDDLLQSLSIINDKNIEDCIYTIRGLQVMLDSDIASFFGIETKNLNKQMKRNIARFPEDFCFQLNSLEFKNLRFQNATTNHGGRRYLPYVYTEHGIIALAGVIKSDVANKMSAEIARKFIQMRKFILEKLQWWNKTPNQIQKIIPLLSNSDIEYVKEELHNYLNHSK